MQCFCAESKKDYIIVDFYQNIPFYAETLRTTLLTLHSQPGNARLPTLSYTHHPFIHYETQRFDMRQKEKITPITPMYCDCPHKYLKAICK